MFIALLFLSLRAAVAAPPEDTCISCHAALGGDLAKPASQFEADIHQQAGLSCADCHGGDAKDETMGAMSRARGFRGAPKKNQIPDFCARCHSDAAYMHRFNPKMRVDQLSQYLTSMHGKRIKQGDVKVAACVDCHSVHNILSVSDTRSPVYPLNVASACAHWISVTAAGGCPEDTGFPISSKSGSTNTFPLASCVVTWVSLTAQRWRISASAGSPVCGPMFSWKINTSPG